MIGCRKFGTKSIGDTDESRTCGENAIRLPNDSCMYIIYSICMCMYDVYYIYICKYYINKCTAIYIYIYYI